MMPYSDYVRSLDAQANQTIARAGAKPVLLSDQTPLSDEEYELSLRRIAEFPKLLAERDRHIRPAEREVLMPAMTYTHDVRDYGYLHAILEGDRRRLNHLRFYTRFTGYSLYYMDYHNNRETPADLPADVDQIVKSRLVAPDIWVQRFVLQMALHPTYFIVPPPRRFAEVGWDVANITVNHDTCVYQERIRMLYQAGILLWLHNRGSKLKRPPLIVEIGTGFGGLAFRLCSLFPEVNYLCIDLPESLVFPNLYLGLTLPGRKHRLITSPDKLTQDSLANINYIPNYLAFDALADIEADLVINTLSFAEMSEAQVASYGMLASTMLKGHGILFEQNQDNRPVGMIDAKPVLERCFPHRMDLPEIDAFGRTEGLPTLWGNRPVTDILKSW